MALSSAYSHRFQKHRFARQERFLSSNTGRDSAGRRLNIFTDQFESIAIAYQDRLSAGLDKAHLTPFGEYPAGGEQGCAGHLCQFLARKRNLDPAMHRLAYMLQQPQQGKGDALGDLLRRHLAKTLLQLIQTGSQDHADVPSDLRVLPNDALKSCVLPNQSCALFHGASCTRVLADRKSTRLNSSH